VSTKTELTGRTRHRALKRWLKPTLLVLQVEERTHGWHIDRYGLSQEIDRKDWRDADVRDFWLMKLDAQPVT
jgi:hypothetical protein